MINIKGIIDDIFIIISKKQTLFEFLLNLSFVLIIFIVIVIFYWDSINRSIIHNSRCKVSIDNSDATYNLKVSNEKNISLFDISYDNTNEHNVKIECACPVGEQINKFQIPYYNNKNDKVEQLSKYCYCEDNYQYENLALDNFKLDGDAFMIDYYDNLFSLSSTGNNFGEKLEFPQS
jgi:hypothetical protein